MSQHTDQHTPAHLEEAPPATGHRARSARASVTMVAQQGHALAYTAYQLSSFLSSQGFVPAFFIAVVAGLSAMLQKCRTTSPGLAARASVRPALAELRPLLTALSGVVVGMSLVALLVAANPQASSASSTTIVEPGAPTLHNVDSTGGSLSIGPFTTAGIFLIYCTIHTGMNLTFVVQ